MRRRPFLQVFYFTSGIILTQSSRLSPRKSISSQTYDPFLICELVGPTHDEGLPLAYSEQVYAELITLCSFAHGARENVGCFCSRANGNVHCDQHLADQNLWNARYTPSDEAVTHQFEVAGFPLGEVTFPEFCEQGCECRTATDAEAWYEENFEGEFNALIGVAGLSRPEELPSTVRQDSNTFAAGGLVGSGQRASQLGWQNRCGNNCTSVQDCSVPAGGNSTCTCLAHSSQYQPGSGTTAFIAACLVTIGSGGKRQEKLPCPCNSTYVSHSCCDASDGLVWESSDSKLGELVMSP